MLCIPRADRDAGPPGTAGEQSPGVFGRRKPRDEFGAEFGEEAFGTAQVGPQPLGDPCPVLRSSWTEALDEMVAVAHHGPRRRSPERPMRDPAAMIRPQPVGPGTWPPLLPGVDVNTQKGKGADRQAASRVRLPGMVWPGVLRRSENLLGHDEPFGRWFPIAAALNLSRRSRPRALDKLICGARAVARCHPRGMRRYYLLAYDVGSDRRRAAVLKAVKAHGLGGQKSAHECWLSKAERRELMRRLGSLTDPTEDRILLLRLDPRSQARQLGKGETLVDPTLFHIA